MRSHADSFYTPPPASPASSALISPLWWVSSGGPSMVGRCLFVAASGHQQDPSMEWEYRMALRKQSWAGGLQHPSMRLSLAADCSYCHANWRCPTQAVSICWAYLHVLACSTCLYIPLASRCEPHPFWATQLWRRHQKLTCSSLGSCALFGRAASAVVLAASVSHAGTPQ